MDRQSETNILLLGQTGVGKSTFINAFANYLSYQCLDLALSQEMITLIPSSFVIADPQTYRVTNVEVGTPSSNEQYDDQGESNTKGCQSYRFLFGNRRIIRLIDTPGVGDTRGLEQDSLNFEHILAYVSQYKYLHGVCILLKPDEQRLTNVFRFCITELLTHLHKSALRNVMFVFTNSKSTFYAPGASVVMLRTLLDQLERSTGVEIPFSANNVFCLDNEAFRFLAASKSNVKFTPAEKEDYAKSWEKSAGELIKLFEFITKCQPHEVQDTLSVNRAQHLIRKLSRPVSEVLKLIEENVQLAKQYEEQAQSGRSGDQRRIGSMPQKSARVIRLDKPYTVCTSEQCTSIKIVNNEVKVIYGTVCHENCRLRNVEQEVINDRVLFHCNAIGKENKRCKKCGCHYGVHMHTTYQYEDYTTYLDLSATQSGQQRGISSSRSTMPFEDWLSSIRRRIEDMRRERQVIVEIASQLSSYLYENSITPYNDSLFEYLKMLIRAEEQKQTADGEHGVVAASLRHLKDQYEREVDFLKKSRPKLGAKDKLVERNMESTMRKTRNVFSLVQKLYELPICGSLIREQVDGLQRSERSRLREQDICVTLPLSGRVSTLAKELDRTFPHAEKRDYTSSQLTFTSI